MDLTSVPKGRGFNLNWSVKKKRKNKSLFFFTFSSRTGNNSVVQPKRCKSKIEDKNYRFRVWRFLVKVLVGKNGPENCSDLPETV